jgi:hypothetical protein
MSNDTGDIMRKKNTFLRICSTLLFFVLIVASITQAIIKTNINDKKTIVNNRDEVGLLSTNIWEDTFNNASKIDPTPPGAGQSDNYVVSLSQVSMANTYSAWTNPAWTKMKPITITNTAGEVLYNYAIHFIIIHESGMQSAYQDIRFKHQNNPSSWLNYWIERYNATSANVWVKVPSLPTGTSTMYLFYGNPSATSQSNFSGVFSWEAYWANDEKTSNLADNEGAWDPDVCFGNGEFLSAWEEGQAWWPPYTWGFKQEIRASIYDTNGNKLVDDKQVFNDDTLYYRNENPSIDYGGGKFFVAWEHYDTVAHPSVTTEDIKARTVVRNGNQLQLGTVINVCSAADCQADANVQFDSVNNRFCVVWEDARNGMTNYNIYGRLYDTNGNPVGGEKNICTVANSQCEPWVAFDPIHGRYMIVWEEGITADNGPFSLKAGIFDENLNQIGTTITIATGSDAVDYNFPCVEFCEQTQRFLVTWNNDDISTGDWWGNIWGKIFDSSGNVVVNTFEIKSGEFVRTDIVPYLSSSFFVSFNTKGSDSNFGLIWGKIISSNGEIIGGDIQLSTSSSALANWANIGVGNNKIFVGWEDVRITYPYPWDNNPDCYSNLWSLPLAGLSVTYVIGNEKQIVLSAHVTSVKIIPTNFNKWDIFNATYIDGTITFDILDGTTGALLLQGVLPETNLFTHGIIAPTIRLKATFTRSNPSTTPKLDKWSVKWELNEPPYVPSSPNPANDSTDVSVTTDLSWTGGDPNGDPVTYDVYFGTTNPPSKIVSNQSGTSYDTGTMNYGTTYYWKIVSWDDHSNSATGPLWQFTTHNDPPNTPGSPNPANGATGISIDADLSWTGGDPNPGDTVTYDVYFGTITPPTSKVSANQSGLSYDPGTMNYNIHYYWKIVAWDNHGASTSGIIWDFTTQNRAPYEPSSPNPPHGATGVAITTDLSWTGGDPDGDPVTYDVYFGTINPPPKVANNQSATTYDLPLLTYGTTYYWKIVAWDNHGASTSSPFWNFMTNSLPYEPSSPSPLNHATGVDINADLSWTGGDPDPGDTVLYDVYFGVTTPPPKVVSNQSVTSYDPGTMNYLMTYHWKIVAWDNHGTSKSGQVWDFTTTFVPNNPPYVPSNPSPQNHANGIDINSDLSWTGGDPDPGDTVTYDIYFGTTSPPPLVSVGYPSSTYDPGTLSYSTPYYWKIIAWDNRGASTPGPLWDFNTSSVPNNPPYVPSSPNPINHATGVSIIANLGWMGGDPDAGDTVLYDVYFGTTTPPPKVVSNQSGTFYDAGTMNYQTTYYWKIVAWDNHGASASSPDWDFTTENEVNNPPYLPSDPFPLNHATNVDISADLSWNGGDPDPGDTVTYDVYFGTTSPPPKVVSNQSGISYNPGTMNYQTTYYWKIIAWDNHDASTQGSLWDFTTIEETNNPPYAPSNPSPEDGSTNVDITVNLGWTGGDPDGDTVTYDVYFGTTSPPTKVVSNQSATTYNPGTLGYTTTYYWKIIAWDNHGVSTEGSIWQFTTEAEPNNPPYTPDNPSPANEATSVDVDTDLSWTGGDPDTGDIVTYDVYFGTTSPPPKLVSNHTSSSYQPATLQENTTYYWKIVAWDNHGASTLGAIWSFTTETTGDTTPPIVNINKPEKAIYFRNNKILPFIITLVFFAIDVEVGASDNDSGIAKVEFYIDDQYKANDTSAPYSWTWSEKSLFFYTLKVSAYDNAGHRADKEITVWKFF